MIFTKSTFSKKHRKNLDLGMVLGVQNHAKSRKNVVEKHEFFKHRFFSVFLRFLANLPGFWEAPSLQKIEKKLKKSIFQRVQF